MPRKVPTYRPPGAPDRRDTAAAYRRRPDRAADNRFYCSSRWRSLRASVLAERPLCVRCQADGRLTLANHVHHVKPREAFPALAYDRDNLEPLCQPCHNAEEVR